MRELTVEVAALDSLSEGLRAVSEDVVCLGDAVEQDGELGL